MDAKKPTHPSHGINLGDIYHVIFRHKWKILIIWAIGLIVGAGLWFFTPATYHSRATLLVKYVVESKPLSSDDPTDTNLRSPDARGTSIMSSELALLTSFDLALDVARSVGPEKILAKTAGGKDLYQAAGEVSAGLKVEAPRNGSILNLSFEHRDQSVVQPILEQVVKSYNQMHVAAHLATGSLDDFWDQQTTETKALLDETERQLREAKAKADVISLPETKKSQAENIARIQTELYNLQAERAAHIATLDLLTNNAAVSTTATNETVTATAAPSAPNEVVDRHKEISTLIDSLQKQLSTMLISLTPESPHVKGLQGTIEAQKQLKSDLEKEYPDLREKRVAKSLNTAQEEVSGTQLLTELSTIRALEAKINVHTQTLARVRKEAAVLGEMEGTIVELERKQKLLDEKYNHFSSRRDRSRFDEQLGPGRISAIKTVQSPTPASRDTSTLVRLVLIIVGGGFAGGLGLAFLIDFYLDRSIKRPVEVEARMGLPLYLSIPKVSGSSPSRLNGKSPALLGDAKAPGAEEGRTEATTTGAVQHRRNPELDAFFEALRDRLIFSFEMRNLVHKPKLIALTSCGHGAGVSTIARGVAASLSKTGDGNVLLVDMNELGHGATHHFHKGKLNYGLDDALELAKRDSAMVEENLYVVSGNTADGSGLPRILQKRFSTLLPRLRASDYDYIIFDMPPVSQLSVTQQLSRFMDVMLVVAESEKTNREVLKRATALLSETTAAVGVVLNKYENRVPDRLLPEEI